MKKSNNDLLEIPERITRMMILNEEHGQLPYMIFYQSKGGWPGFQLCETLKEAEMVVDRMKINGLKPVLYLDLSDVEIVEHD